MVITNPEYGIFFRIYIKDSDRLSFSEQALTMCTQCLRTQIKTVCTMSNPQIVKLLQEIFKVYQRLQKHLPGKESPFSTMLVEVYKQFIKEKVSLITNEQNKMG